MCNSAGIYGDWTFAGTPSGCGSGPLVSAVGRDPPLPPAALPAEPGCAARNAVGNSTGSSAGRGTSHPKQLELGESVG